MEKTVSDGLPVPQRYGAILTIAIGIMMAVLDGTIANVALPSIAHDLNATPASSIWIINAYQIAIVATLLTLSFLGDMFGYRRVYQYGLGVFVVASLLCAFSRSLEMLTLLRILQGLGGAALMSVNVALIRMIYPQRYLGRGMGINSLIVAASAAAGPTIAAAILSVATWHWLFLINVPLGLIALVLAIRFLPPNQHKSQQRFDFPSAVMNALTFGLLITALGNYADGGFDGVLALQLVALVSLPFFMQTTLGLSEVQTGLLLTPWPLATMVVAPLSGYLVERIHAGLLGGLGLAVMACGLFSLAWLPTDPGNVDIIWRMILCGAGFGLFQSPNNHTIVSAAPRHRSGGASGMLGTARLLGQGTGAALVALMFTHFSNAGEHASLLLAGILATVAALVSVLRITAKAAA